MRSDYLSYITAIICFLLAAIAFVITFAITPAFLDLIIGAALTAVLLILGIILVGFGYTQRPKETAPPSTQVQQAHQVQQVTVQATPTTTLPEEPKKPQEESKPEAGPVRKRRKKT